jgi:hypothetical protein
MNGSCENVSEKNIHSKTGLALKESRKKQQHLSTENIAVEQKQWAIGLICSSTIF